MLNDGMWRGLNHLTCCAMCSYGDMVGDTEWNRQVNCLKDKCMLWRGRLLNAGRPWELEGTLQGRWVKQWDDITREWSVCFAVVDNILICNWKYVKKSHLGNHVSGRIHHAREVLWNVARSHRHPWRVVSGHVLIWARYPTSTTVSHTTLLNMIFSHKLTTLYDMDRGIFLLPEK